MTRTLKQLRQSRRYTLKQLAERVGCSPQTLGLYETNPPAAVSRDISDGLAKALDVTPEYILKLLGSTAVASRPATSRRTREKTAPTKTAPTKAASSGRKRTARAARVFSAPQRALMATLIQNEIRRLREFILEAECSACEDGPLKQTVQETQGEIQALQALGRLIVTE